MPSQTFAAAGPLSRSHAGQDDAIEFGKKADMPLPPVMIYGDDVSHVVTEEGVAYLYKAGSLADRRAALAAIAGVTPVGRGADASQVEGLRRDGLAGLPEDLRSTRTWPTGPAGRPEHR